MELEFLAECEVWLLDEVDGFSSVVFDDFVGYGQRFEVFVYEGEFVFWTQNFQSFVRMFALKGKNEGDSRLN